MIAVSQISRSYGDFQAVDKVSFTIGHGEIVGLLGHNGAGKTTIMKMLTGFLEPSNGSITIDGLNMETNRSAIQERIGYLPENCPLYTEMTVIDYLEYAASLHNIPESERDPKVRETIEQTDLKPKAMEKISTLSRGYRQRVGVAQSILHSPKIVILDEPTNGLDPNQIFQMRALIKKLARSATVIVSTHILQEVQAICDRVIILYNGKTYLDARLEDLQKADRLTVETDAKPDRAKVIFDSINGIKAFELLTDENGYFRYSLAAGEGGQTKDIASIVAKTVVERGYSLFLLSQEIRDLETIFSEMSKQDGRSVQ
ncbi:MAG: ATP-binding cassette domain-containing protein [Syntrophales bacterium]|jgi:ABC-2 type transport system ATP-binding protein|nr:ATP-binding cassette domain-containing protein [Syntrophales bacterium]